MIVESCRWNIRLKDISFRTTPCTGNEDKRDKHEGYPKKLSSHINTS
jgi:hypothetical protein